MNEPRSIGHKDVDRLENDGELGQPEHDGYMLANICHLLIDLLATAKLTEARLSKIEQTLTATRRNMGFRDEP